MSTSLITGHKRGYLPVADRATEFPPRPVAPVKHVLGLMCQASPGTRHNVNTVAFGL